MLTYRESRYVVERSKGKSKHEALIAAGFSHALAKNPQFIETPKVLKAIEAYREELVNNALEVGLIDAKEIHEYLTDALRADMRDIRNEDGSFKPQSEWPEIWGRMMEAGDVEVEKTFDRSDDGQDQEKRGGWDESGTVVKVKLKFSSRVKLLELAMRHTAVRALHEPSSVNVNINVVSVEQRLQAGLKRVAAMLPEGKDV